MESGRRSAVREDDSGNRSVSGWTEGDAWVYTWSPLHDQAGLLQLMGGAEAYDASWTSTSAADTTCTATNPVTTTAICTTSAGSRGRRRRRCAEIAAKEYQASPGGLDGDDDCGQMSAWLLFTAMGFYPVNPASGEYMIGSPNVSRRSRSAWRTERHSAWRRATTQRTMSTFNLRRLNG